MVAVVGGCSLIPQVDNLDDDSREAISSGSVPVSKGIDETPTLSNLNDDLMTPADVAELVGGAVWRVDVDQCDIQSGGTAFAISDSMLLTNWHVIEFDFEPTITSRDGVELQGRVIGYSVTPDIAVIEVVDDEVFQWVEFVAPSDLREGDPIISIGYPVPYATFSVSPGWVTSFIEEDGERVGIVSDESSDFGSSGGPLFDLYGRVVGVVTEFTPAEGLQPNGVSYTTEALDHVIEEIIENPQVLDTDCSGSSFGTDHDLDVLWAACADGRYWACDVLYMVSSVGTDYESYGARCGEADVEAEVDCVELFDTSVPYEFGEDDVLDEAWSACEMGDLEHCDHLYAIAPFDSRYEDFGASCGDRFVGNEDLCTNRKSIRSP